MIEKHREGIALITTSVLTLIALILSISLFLMLKSSTFMSGAYKRYSSSLEINKGIANYIIQGILDDELKCLTPDGKCANNSEIDLDGLSKIGDFESKAKILTIIELPDGTRIYSIEIETKNKKTGEKSTVDFVYKVE